ncbi:phosphoglycolate phosphatase [Shewanella sp. AS16]|uniref:phosphoglycolate phosphatase n=1 Tax=Shewanella sp. AS16 TaxID=2907625 RepID=UPI001F1C076A|nr:phosphoglycolate phosphatase [Shewanella sp. AS16]MCE9686038.1 phosphoglycolate phosphatase [Shewanella sp. AS16]
MVDWTRLEAIALDLDGTLVDSVPDLAAATRATLEELGLAPCSEADVRLWVGNGARTLMHRAMSRALGHTVSESSLDAAMPVFMRHYGLHLQRHSRLYDGVYDTLAQLSTAGYRLALVTNKPYEFAVALLRGFGLEGFFSLVFGGDSLERMKPDPLPLQHVLHEWRLEKSQLLMVGDSNNDIFAAKAAGIASIGLTYGYNYGEDIRLCGPDAVCDQFNDILTRILFDSGAMEQLDV